MKTKEELQPLFSELGNIQSVQDFSVGYDQLAYKVTCDTDIFMYKEPRRDKHKLYNEIMGTKIANELEIPAPQVIISKDDYLIESFIQGKTLRDDPQPKFFYELGSYLARLHVKPCDYVGEKHQRNTSHQDMFDAFMPEKIKYMANHFQLPGLVNYFEERRNFLDYDPVYIHGDMGSTHVYVQDRGISGIIDWGDLAGGCAEDELGRYLAFNWDAEEFDHLLKGYGESDKEKIRFFALYRLTWHLHHKITSGKKVRDWYEPHYRKLYEGVFF